MKATHLYLLSHMLLTAGVLVDAFDPITTTVVVGVGATLGRTIWNYLHESCDSKWIGFNATGLKHDLDTKLFGQHIASPIILKTVTGFMRDENPRKPLVLSLHGWTGTGKSFVSQLIAKNIYKEGMKSNFFHLFPARLRDPPEGQFSSFKLDLQQWIEAKVRSCERSMFIFDEMDKMHPGLIDSIIPYLDYHDKLDGVSYRKAIFIFLSNTGADHIKDIALDFWKQGEAREEIKLKDLEQFVSTAAFNKKESGFERSGLISKNMVDFFVPFLPLEHEHVIKCVYAEMKARGLQLNKEVAHQLVDELVFTPRPERVYSSAGCKTVSRRLDNYTP